MAKSFALLAGAVTLASAGHAEDKASPVSRVVNLLKEMMQTVESEQAEDKKMHGKQMCLCNDGNWEKGNAKEASENKIAELESAIKSGTSRSSELNAQIKDLEAQVASNTDALTTAKSLRAKELEAFHGYELDAIQNIENMKAALTVMSKHESLVQEDSSSALSFLAVRRTKEMSWTQEHDASHIGQSLEEFLRRDGITDYSDHDQGVLAPEDDHPAAISGQDKAVVQKAMKSVRAFLQTHEGDEEPASGEIIGVMKQLKEEMEKDLKEAQEKEKAAIADFDELRTDKTQEIEDGEAMAEKKEDELATTDNDLAEAKEDLEQEQVSLQATTEFLNNLDKECKEAEKAFETRSQERADEGKAISETMAILQSDEARDVFGATFNFLQMSKSMSRSRSRAALTLRKAASKSRDPMLSLLATRVELDAFGKVKKSIDDMVAQLKMQQEEEVKKNDWCKSQLQETEMTTLKTEDHKGDLEAKEAKLESNIEGLKKSIDEAKAAIAELTVDLQRASMNKKQQNLDHQKVISDQILTVEILKKALDKLSEHYGLLQVQGHKSAGAGGVMQMIEKLIQDAGQLQKDATAEEAEAQAAYEQTIADTNDSIEALQKEVGTKTKTLAKVEKHLLQKKADIQDTLKELEGLSGLTADLHKDCDYIVKNFDTRQQARAKETEALQQAKQILSGANLS